jgi:hypothetical protein
MYLNYIYTLKFSYRKMISPCIINNYLLKLMGNKQSAIKNEIETLFKVASMAEFQNKIVRLINLPLSIDEVFTYIYPTQIR